MTTKILFSFLISILYPIVSFSQAEAETTDFIILVSGEKIVGNKVIKKRSQVFIDENVYKSKSVMFYQNKSGNFAQTPFGFQGRMIDGKVSVYSFSRVNPKQTLNPINSWYTMDNSFVKRTSYSNLRKDLKDNISSMQYLNSYRNLTFLGLGMVGIGTGITMYHLMQAFQPQSSFNISKTIYIGLFSCLSGSIVLQIAPRKMFKAIKVYNRSNVVPYKY